MKPGSAGIEARSYGQSPAYFFDDKLKEVGHMFIKNFSVPKKSTKPEIDKTHIH